MEALKYFVITLSCLLLVSVAFRCIVAQGRASASEQLPSEVELLRRQVEQHKAEIQALQNSLQKESEHRANQQQLLEALQQKLEQLSSSVSTTGAAPSPSQTSGQTPVELDRREASKPETVADRTSDVQPHDVQAGFGKIKFNGLLQAWFSSGNGGFSDTFRVRRAELKFTGEVTPEVKWTVMIDPAKVLSLNNTFVTTGGATVVRDSGVNQAGRILQDAFITLSYFKRMNINVGQFKVPLSLEGLQSSAGLDTERALFMSDRGRGGTFGDIRDIGLMLYGPLTKSVDYQVGVFSGSGESQNDTDKNDQKAVAGRMVFRPSFFKGLQVGGSGVWGNGARADRARRDRLGGELLFVRGPLTLKGELMTGKDGLLHRRGYYGHLAYHFTPKWEGIFRFDTWDPDTRQESNATNVTERDYVTGFNYFINESHVKFQFNYLHKTYTNGIVPSQNQAVFKLQTWW
jgi:hypothetical protein